MRDAGQTAVPERVAASERRPLTILFADIAGSTSIAETLDPEDWTELVGTAFNRLNAVAARYGGTVARLMGDGVLVFFGAPVAHEGDAVNIAARMQAAAPPGGVMITAATHRFVAPLVEAIDAGRLELKGKAEAV